MDDSHPKSQGEIHATLARLALENGIITRETLKKAFEDIRLEKARGNDLSLEDYLMEHGLVARETMSRLIAATVRAVDKKFAALVVSLQLAPEAAVSKALELQKEAFKTGTLKSVANILIEAKLITPEQRNFLLAKLNEPQDVDAPNSGAPEKPGSIGEPPGKNPEIQTPHDPDKSPSLVVTSNGLRADIHIPGGLEKKTGIQDIRALVTEHGLKFGVISDQEIENHLSRAGEDPCTFVVALGIPALPPRDAAVRVFFINNYLNPGKITDHGTIDFKDRGAVPYVNTGVVLAEKIPGVDGKPGYDVFGNEIPSEQATDQPLKSGPGTVVSDDGLKIIATMDGQPLMTVHGEVTVMKELHIPGDVDYTTGNIIFNGSIIVKGSINPGFIIKGGNLTARDVNGAEIDVAGNIEISGGIIDSVLRAGGGVHAMHMSRTKVDNYGDVLVKKEVIDCKIRTSGAFTGESVRVVSSLVSAKKGILARQIGTDVSRACTLRVGINDHTEKKIRYFREEVEERKKALEKEQKKKEEFQSAQKQLHKKIMDQAQLEDRLSHQKIAIEEKIREIRCLGNLDETSQRQLRQLEEGLVYCAAEIKKMNDREEELLKNQDQLTNYILDLQGQCESLVEDIENLNEKIKEIRTWDRKTPPLPQVKVIREIFAQTIVNGPNSMMIVKDTCRNVTIREARRADHESEWEIRIDPN
jgi:uncharacterized protein (DUF342 family)